MSDIEAEQAVPQNASATAEDAGACSNKVAEQSTEITEKVLEVYSSFTENIPQLDGGLEVKTDDPNYCIICKDSDEIESAEDFSYHMMNDHDPQEVLAIFGQTWIEDRRHCIRRGSPFEKWVFTPII